MKPIICKVFGGNGRRVRRSGVQSILLEVKGDQALVKPRNHGAPFWVPLRQVHISKTPQR